MVVKSCVAPPSSSTSILPSTEPLGEEQCLTGLDGEEDRPLARGATTPNRQATNNNLHITSHKTTVQSYIGVPRIPSNLHITIHKSNS